MALSPSTSPLVWIDCEMTGLDPTTDVILSVACIVTAHDLRPLGSTGPFEVVVHRPDPVLDGMGEWCTAQHGASGLTAASRASATSEAAAAAALAGYVRALVPEAGAALLAGSSVHMDRAFLARGPWADLLGWLHYRILDVSALKEAARRWARPEVLARAPLKSLKHEALSDVRESIEEARFYMEEIFKPT